MGIRSQSLHDISQLLGRQYYSVQDLRNDRPDIDRLFPNLNRISDINELIRLLKSGDPLPSTEQVKRPSRPHKSLLTYEQIRQMRKQGQKLRTIACGAGVSIARVGQICSE